MKKDIDQYENGFESFRNNQYKALSLLSKRKIIREYFDLKQSNSELIKNYNDLLIKNGGLLINSGFDNLELCNKLNLFESTIFQLVDRFKGDIKFIDDQLKLKNNSNETICFLKSRKSDIYEYLEILEKNIGHFYKKNVDNNDSVDNKNN